MKALWVCLLLGAFCLPCMGAETFLDVVDIGETIWDTPLGSFNDTATWSHSVPGEALGNITDATLTIDVSGICEHDELFSPADDHVSIYLNGTYLGDLTGLETVFSGSNVINALTVTEPSAAATIQWDYFGKIWWADAANILTSTLEGEYVADYQAVVPAPSAILLAGLGTTLVGLLRKRD